MPAPPPLAHALVLGAGLVGHLTVGWLGLLLTGPLAVAPWLAGRASWRTGAETTGPVTATDLFGRLAAAATLVAWAWPHLVGATRLNGRQVRDHPEDGRPPPPTSPGGLGPT